MHILILADPVDDQHAGVHFYTRRLIENLLKIDRKNHYTFIHKRPNSFFKTSSKTSHYIIARRKIPGYGKFRKLILVPRLIRKLKPDIVLEPCHLGPFNIPKSIKRAVMIHDLTPINMPQFHIPGSVRRHRTFLKQTLQNADLILTASETTKNDIKKYCPQANKIQVVPLGVDPPLKSTKSTQKSPLKSPYLLYLGTIEPRKNLELLIDTFTELKNSHKIPHKLVLAGEIGWKSDKIIKKAHSNPDIILTGYLSQKQKATYYSHADIFIYPSLYEGFGLPPLEAISYKIPVISSNGGSLGEILDGHAILFPPKNKARLKSQILTLLKKSPTARKTLTQKALLLTKNLTWKHTARKTLKALEETVRKC